VPGAALTLGLVLVASALVVAIAVRRGESSWVVAAYAAVVVAIPIAGGPLLTAVGDDRSSAAVTQVTAAVVARESAAGAPAEVLGVGAYIPSLPFYLKRTVPIATVAGRELTSNYIADYVDRFRDYPAPRSDPQTSGARRLPAAPRRRSSSSARGTKTSARHSRPGSPSWPRTCASAPTVPALSRPE
jgi:hypothetical protein